MTLPVAVAGLALGSAAAPSATAAVEPAGKAPRSSGLTGQEKKNEKSAIAVLDVAFNKKDPKRATEKYISAKTYIQHNPDFADGRDAFVAAVTSYVKKNPDSSSKVVRTVTQGDLVLVHGLSKANKKDRGTVAADIFRFDNKGKIVEHWDVLQPVAKTSKNGNPQV
ncbi:nuclear transport factor 2 family protein [Streptomyces sp. NPDC006872]|uniref:nuclear transport factor 2 family protein n=1 Tax=Streptomyces sp. NPDC006872 TaxID=3155720 RepID=UPI0033D693C7